MPNGPLILPALSLPAPGAGVRGAGLVIQNWRAAGETVLVPAGVAHTFGNARPEPSRYLLIVPSRLDELISSLHSASAAERASVYRRHESELLE